MADLIYSLFERPILRFETQRRGRARARRAQAAAVSISHHAELPGLAARSAVVSFDVFDTLIRRRLAPEAILRKTAGFARLLAGVEAGSAVWTARHEFAGALKAAMIDADEGDEPALGAILEAALEAAGISGAPALAARLVAFETAAEAEGASAAPGAVETVRALREAGKRVVAVSDMYLPAASVTAILDRAGFGGLFEQVFVSSEYRWTKQSGRLFPIVLEAIAVAPGDALHIGDRIDKDVRPAEAAGLASVHYLDRAALGAQEAKRLAESWVPSAETRRARLRAAHDFASHRSLGDAEALIDQIFGPAIALLALKGLGEAHRIGARRLFHLSRDATIAGEVAEKAARSIPWLANDSLEIRELAVSRAQGALLSLRRAEHLPKLRHLLPYLTGSPPSAKALRTAFGLDAEFSPALESARGDQFMGVMSREPGAVLAALAPARERLETYLEAAGLFAEGSSVALDIGYSGTFAAQLSALFAAEPERARRIDFLFLLTSRNIEINLRRIHPAIRLRTGVALDYRRRSARFATRTFAWAEPFLVDPERGRLRGYAGNAPLFEESPLDDAARAVRRALRTTLKERALRFLREFPGGPGDIEELSALLQRRIVRFAGRPTRGEERTVRSLSHQTGQSTVTANEPTRTVNPFRLLSEIEALRREDRWIAGSLTRSGLGLVSLALADAPDPDLRSDPRLQTD